MTKLSKSKVPEQKSTKETISSALRNICVTRPTASLAIGKKGNSSETIDKIIAAAREVFTEDGHPGLSLRKVAENAGIAVGNLTYHFPSKRSLLDAMLEETRAGYAQEHLKLFEDQSLSSFDIIESIMVNYVTDARSSNRFFLQMWGYAASDEDAKRTVQSFYEDQSLIIYELLRDANPDLTHDDRHRVLLQIASLGEGFRMFLGIGVGVDKALTYAEDQIRDMTYMIVYQKFDNS